MTIGLQIGPAAEQLATSIAATVDRAAQAGVPRSEIVVVLQRVVADNIRRHSRSKENRDMTAATMIRLLLETE